MAFAVKIDRREDVEALDYETAQKAALERSEVLEKIFDEAGPTLDASKVTVVTVDDGQGLAKHIDARNDELGWLGERIGLLRKAEDVKAHAARVKRDANSTDPHPFASKGSEIGDGRDPDDPTGTKSLPQKSVGRAIIESDYYEKIRNREPGRVEIAMDVKSYLLNQAMEMKTAFTTSAGWAPEDLRIGRVVLDAQRPIDVLDAIPMFRTGMSTVKFMEETTFTNNAAERAENAAYAESALALTEQSDEVESIGTSLPVTDEQIEDVEGVEDYLEGRLMFMVRQRLDSQVINGDGSTPNLEGTLNESGIQTQAKGTDSVPDAVYKAMTKVRFTGRAESSVAIFNPNDWQDIRLLTTADGVYIWGSPADAGPERIWGVPVIQTTAIAENTGLVGDFARYSGLFVRRNVLVETGYVNDDFLDGRVTIRAGMRCAMVHFRPAAFATVTGI